MTLLRRGYVLCLAQSIKAALCVGCCLVPLLWASHGLCADADPVVLYDSARASSENAPYTRLNNLITTGDVDNDGRTEIIAQQHGQTWFFLRITRWNGVGLDKVWDGPEWGSCQDFVVGDADNDGRPELVVVGYLPHEHGAQTASGQKMPDKGYAFLIGSFENNRFSAQMYWLAAETERVAVGDVDGDGMQEIIAARVEERGEEYSKGVAPILPLLGGVF